MIARRGVFRHLNKPFVGSAGLPPDPLWPSKDKGDLEGAQRYTERALAIVEKVYGPDHPSVRAKGDLEGAQRYTERALAIDEKVYGPDHPTVTVGWSGP